MAVSPASVGKAFYNIARGMGERVIASDCTFVISGHEEMIFLLKGHPFPIYSQNEPAEVPLPMGFGMWQGTQGKQHYQGSVMLMETLSGHLSRFLRDLKSSAFGFDGIMYLGTPDAHHRSLPVYGVLLNIEAGEVDYESRTQLMMFSGQMSYHYFDEAKPGPLAITQAIG